MVTTDDHDTIARARLVALGEELDKLKQGLEAATTGHTALPYSPAEILESVATATEQCERIIEDHATGAARVSDAALVEVATALRIVRETITAIVRFTESRLRPGI